MTLQAPGARRLHVTRPARAGAGVWRPSPAAARPDTQANSAKNVSFSKLNHKLKDSTFQVIEFLNKIKLITRCDNRIFHDLYKSFFNYL